MAQSERYERVLRKLDDYEYYAGQRGLSNTLEVLKVAKELFNKVPELAEWAFPYHHADESVQMQYPNGTWEYNITILHDRSRKETNIEFSGVRYETDDGMIANEYKIDDPRLIEEINDSFDERE